MSTNHRLLTVKEVADILRLNILTVYEYLKSGKLMAVKFGRSYRVQEKDLESFINDHLARK